MVGNTESDVKILASQHISPLLLAMAVGTFLFVSADAGALSSPASPPIHSSEKSRSGWSPSDQPRVASSRSADREPLALRKDDKFCSNEGVSRIPKSAIPNQE